MYLQKLAIHGFKSFVSPTDLEFDPGITAIVGPNGCGKSNIVDALRWVIGEQRSRVLRSDKMDSVIFNGTSSRKAVGLAEVQLTISNTRGVLPLEYSEVTLGRRLYRSGEAEYLLNGIECRLRDITDLFTDTGMGAGAYSVIELKMVDEILSENTMDRRRLFEEASGITRYKKRRSDALRKLDTMRVDLDRVRDLTDEISAQVRSLKRQAQIAERFLRYKEQVRTSHIALLKFEHDRLLKEDAVLVEEEANLADISSGMNAQIHVAESQLESLQANFVNEEKKAQVNRQAFVEHEQRIIKLEGDIRLEQANKETITQNIDRLAVEQDDLTKESQELGHHQKLIESTLKTVISEVDKARRVLDHAINARDDAKHQLDASEQDNQSIGLKFERLSQQKSEYQRETDRLQSRITHLTEEKHRLEAEFHSASKEYQDAEQIAQQAKDDLTLAKENLDHIRDEYDKALIAHQGVQNKINRVTTSVQALEKDLAAKDGEVKILEDLVRTYDFFPDAVRYLLTEVDEIHLLPLGDMIECAPEYRAALAASLEPCGGSIIVNTEQEAKMAAAQLRSEEKGRAHFIVLDKVPPVSRSIEYSQNELLNVIRVHDEAYRSIIHHLLEDVLLVESLDDALRLFNKADSTRFRYVTLEGEWVDGRGVFFAGGSEEGGTYSHLARRDSLRTAIQSSSDLQQQINHHKDQLNEAYETLQRIDLQGIERRLNQTEQVYLEADRISEKNAQICAMAANQVAVLNKRNEAISNEISELQINALPQDDQLHQIDQELIEIQRHIKSKEKEIQSLRLELDQMQSKYLDAHTASVKEVAHQERLEADLQRIIETQQRISERMERFATEQSSLMDNQHSVANKLSKLDEQLSHEKSQRQTLGELQEKDKSKEYQLRLDLENASKQLRTLQRSLQEINQKETTIQVKYSAVKARLEDIVLRAQEDYSVDLEKMPTATDIDEYSLKEQIQETERKLQAMGNVNALALDEYKKQSQRLEFMMEQCADLEEAEKTLMKTINEINRTASKKFLDTYLLIQENFQELFRELFGERAKCELGLSNSDDVLESPITVTARPSGKRPVSITQLSSGEKTLTAIALLFAIYLIKPSPFCFLDEVDAPLDDSNVDHFMRVIQRFSSETQFVLITHNKRTMEMANRLYGVTMQEEGVSSLVSVHFDEAVSLGR